MLQRAVGRDDGRPGRGEPAHERRSGGTGCAGDDDDLAAEVGMQVGVQARTHADTA